VLGPYLDSPRRHTFAQRFRQWWSAPITTRDRVLGAIVGTLGGLWLGFLARVVFGPLPVSGSEVMAWTIGGAAVGLLFGAAAPKVTTVVCFPFSTFGGIGT
jgi:hypothetical protein